MSRHHHNPRPRKETKMDAQTLINILIDQRNEATNQVATLRAELSDYQKQVQELKKALAEQDATPVEADVESLPDSGVE